tara:strand:- start:120 stop:707 length:588 start_codon:yes stop_codon:yes gene_type:complete
MSKSFLYQSLIAGFIIIILIFTYNFLYNKKKIDFSNTNNKNITNESSDSEVGSKIDDIYYLSKDELGNSYEITAEFGEIDQKNLDIIKLKNVNGVIDINDTGIIYISSKNAIYNRVNLNTYFYEEAKLSFEEHKITSNEIDMNYVNKNIKISGDVNYLNNQNFLKADIIEMDMLKKISRIYMKEKENKVKALIIN